MITKVTAAKIGVETAVEAVLEAFEEVVGRPPNSIEESRIWNAWDAPMPGRGGLSVGQTLDLDPAWPTGRVRGEAARIAAAEVGVRMAISAISHGIVTIDYEDLKKQGVHFPPPNADVYLLMVRARPTALMEARRRVQARLGFDRCLRDPRQGGASTTRAGGTTSPNPQQDGQGQGGK
jgi:hypothetical protein